MSEYRWVDLGNGRKVFRRLAERPSAKSHLPCPHIGSDSLPDAVQSAADGKFYTSKAALRSSYLPSGNPQGERYIEVGNDPARLRPSARPKSDRKAIRQSIDRATARYAAGERLKT